MSVVWFVVFVAMALGLAAVEVFQTMWSSKDGKKAE